MPDNARRRRPAVLETLPEKHWLRFNEMDRKVLKCFECEDPKDPVTIFDKAGTKHNVRIEKVRSFYKVRHHNTPHSLARSQLCRLFACCTSEMQ